MFINKITYLRNTPLKPLLFNETCFVDFDIEILKYWFRQEILEKRHFH